MYMLRLKSLVASLSLVLSAAALGAQEGPAGRPSVLVTLTSAAGDAFRPVVAEAVAYKLRQYSLEVVYRDDLPALSGSASGVDTDFLLNCRYSQAGSQMEISLGWRDQRTGLLVAAVERQGRVDLVLDTLILEALDELLTRVEGRIAERLVRAPATPPAAPPAIAPAAQPALGDSPSIPPAPPAAPAPLPEAAARDQDRFVLSPGLAPFLAVGAASYYFPVGLQSLVRGDFLLRAGRGTLGLGVLLGVTYFKAQGATEDSINFLVPLAASVR